MKKLKNISDIRRFFHRNETPIYFVSATNFNLLGISEWVRNFHYINYIDCFDGRHPSVLVPSESPHREFEGIEDINNYLLQHKEVIDFIEKRGPGGKAVFLMFNEETEELCKELGLDVWFPSAELRSEVDNKIETVRIGNKAGVPSVPNILSKVESYEQMRNVSKDLGEHLVLQSAFGEGGGDQDHEAGQRSRLGDRGLHHQARHHRGSVDDRTRRLQGIDALQGRLVRQRNIRRRLFAGDP